MFLQQLTVNRIIIHQIYQRDIDGNKIEPLQSHNYTRFTYEAMQAFKTRVISALGHDSRAVQMEIVNQGVDGLPSIIDRVHLQDDDSFAVSSFDIARKLSDAQQTRSIPGGILVIFDGKQGHEQKNYLGIIKAEVHSGYEKETNPKTNEISLKFVEELLLTPGTRLYKTAGFFENNNPNNSSVNLNEKWTVFVSDYQINKVDGKAAAKYFYSDFLGCDYPHTSARTTKQFYDATKSFITSLNISQNDKIHYYNALTTYLKLETSPSISASEFGSRYFDIDTQDAFINHIDDLGIPTQSFTKDTEHIESKLKFRKVYFNSNIRIIAPSEVFTKKVSIEKIDGESDEAGNPTEWTKVIIKDRISDQE